MKKAILAIATILLMTACAKNYPNNIHEDGIGPVLIGMDIKDVPGVVAGLYDNIEIKHTPACYDEMEDETIPAYDTYFFKLGKETIFSTSPSSDGEIEYLDATSPILNYRGIFPGMSCRDVLLTEAKLMAAGNYSSCYFYCCFRFADANHIDITFPITGGASISRKGASKLYKTIEPAEGGYYELNFTQEDFRKNAKISKIQVGGK